MASFPAQPPTAPSLRDKQIANIRAMLGDQSSDAVDDIGLPNEPQWKILVYDSYGKDIVAPLLSVSQLREIGVTLYLQLDAEREHIPETSVVYFVLPTKANVDRICKDLEEELYDKVQLNFLSAVSSDLLEQLAAAAISSQTTSTIERVFDMYTNFICLEHDFFITREQAKAEISYRALHGPGSDAEMESSIDQIVNSLFCVLVSMGTVPIIRCSRDHAAQMIAQNLDKKLRDHLKLPRSSMFKEGVSITGSFQRPLLALVDRHTDVSTIMHHTSTYQALGHDVLDYKLNRVSYSETKKQPSGPPQVVKKSFDVDSKTDKFWAANRGKPFPEVAEAVEQELADARKKEDDIRNAGGGAAGGDDAQVDVADSTNRIKMAVSSLPQLMEQKKKLNGHMSMLMAIMDKIKEGGLDDYYGTEEDLMNEAPLEPNALTDLLKQKGSERDKLRLYIIALLGGGLKPDEIEKCESILKAKGCDMAVVTYARELVKLREGRKNHRASTTEGGGKDSMFSQALDTGAGWWKQGVKKLLPSESMGTVTQVIDALMDLKPSELTQNYLYMDPKQLRPGPPTTTVPKGRAPFDECMVFMVGGGNFCEYQNLSDYAQRNRKTITYGCSELVSADQFLDQMSVLGGGPGSK